MCGALWGSWCRPLRCTEGFGCCEKRFTYVILQLVHIEQRPSMQCLHSGADNRSSRGHGPRVHHGCSDARAGPCADARPRPWESSGLERKGKAVWSTFLVCQKVHHFPTLSNTLQHFPTFFKHFRTLSDILRHFPTLQHLKALHRHIHIDPPQGPEAHLEGQQFCVSLLHTSGLQF